MMTVLWIKLMPSQLLLPSSFAKNSFQSEQAVDKIKKELLDAWSLRGILREWGHGKRQAPVRPGFHDAIQPEEITDENGSEQLASWPQISPWSVRDSSLSKHKLSFFSSPLWFPKEKDEPWRQVSMSFSCILAWFIYVLRQQKSRIGLRTRWPWACISMFFSFPASCANALVCRAIMWTGSGNNSKF